MSKNANMQLTHRVWKADIGKDVTRLPGEPYEYDLVGDGQGVTKGRVESRQEDLCLMGSDIRGCLSRLI